MEKSRNFCVLPNDFIFSLSPSVLRRGGRNDVFLYREIHEKGSGDDSQLFCVQRDRCMLYIV